MKLKAIALEKLINESIDGVVNGNWDNESFAIFEEAGVQVLVMVTTEETEMVDGVLPEYEKASL